MALQAVEATRMGPIQMPDMLMLGASEARYDGTLGRVVCVGRLRQQPDVNLVN